MSKKIKIGLVVVASVLGFMFGTSQLANAHYNSKYYYHSTGDHHYGNSNGYYNNGCCYKEKRYMKNKCNSGFLGLFGCKKSCKKVCCVKKPVCEKKPVCIKKPVCVKKPVCEKKCGY